MLRPCPAPVFRKGTRLPFRTIPEQDTATRVPSSRRVTVTLPGTCGGIPHSGSYIPGVAVFESFQEARMVLKSVSAAILCTTLLAWSGASIADEYRPDEFLGLDLSSAVLSPKRLGPATEFAPVPIEAKAEPKPVHTERIILAKPDATTQVATHVRHARNRPAPTPRPRPRAMLRMRVPKNRAARLAPNSCGGTAIRSMRRRSIRGFRPGRASRAASATGRRKSSRIRTAAARSGMDSKFRISPSQFIHLSQNLRLRVKLGRHPPS